jgi:hypothetical protein
VGETFIVETRGGLGKWERPSWPGMRADDAPETRGVSYRLFAPVVVRDTSRQQFPPPVRAVLRLIGASDYLLLHFHNDQKLLERIQFTPLSLKLR